MNNLINKIANIYIENKKVIDKVLIILGIALIFGVISSLLLNSNNDGNIDKPSEVIKESRIILFGENEIVINQGETYVEPGYYAYDEKGEIKTELVEVNNTLNTNKPGRYVISYVLGEKVVYRTIKVIEKKEVGSLSLNLIGGSVVVLSQGEEYIEPGYTAIDTVDGDLNQFVSIKGEVNTLIEGTYTLEYSVSNSTGQIKTITRTVIVNQTPLDVSLTLSNNDYTKDSITITINVIGSNFDYVRFPDNVISSKKVSTYKVDTNGTYKFYIYDKNGNHIIKEISINNIDISRPSGTCNANIMDGKTYINVYANDSGSGIKKYIYYGNNLLLNTQTSSSYTANGVFSNVYVTVFDKANNQTRLDCKVSKQYDLEVHFINVGREDAILIRSQEKTIFIDGGLYNKKSTITPYLKNLGITKIDVMIGSHLHNNHIQAQADLLENFTVDKIYYPQDLNTCYSTYCDKNDQKYILDAIKKYNKTISIMKVNDNITIGDMNIFCVGPIKFQTKSQNKYRQNFNSLNFILTYGNTKFMFTGDYMQSSNILSKFNANMLDIDVLKYPHHGQSSIGKKIIEAMTPSYTVITNSKDGLSGRTEKTYLQNVGSKLLYSYKDGNILMISDGNKITVKTNVKASDYKR